MEALSSDSMAIGDLAARSGVPIATIRSWESRYGFPRPSRQAGGHRRYVETDVDDVLEVVRLRSSGLAMANAVRRVTAAAVRDRSVFAGVRRLHPELTPRVLSKRTLAGLSRAIEDECCARAAEPLLFGGFQREEYLRQSSRRWREMARTSRATVTFAQASSDAPPSDGSLTEVWLPEGAPLSREWLVVCDAVDLPAFLAAVELPTQRILAEAERPFETIWSVDPQVVRAASRVAAALADDYQPEWRTDSVALPEEDDPAPASDDLRRAQQLFGRMLDYLEVR